jgi:redox-sensing transcriptional repressor
MGSPARIPQPTATRITLYLRELEARLAAGHFTVRSRQLGASLGLTDAQVRKDFGHLGQFGQAGVGYRIDTLLARIRQLVGVDRGWAALLVGVGNIGRALLSYRRFEQEGFRIVAAFDAATRKVGSRVGEHEVRPLAVLPEVVAEHGVRLGIIATPADAAQEVADRLVAAGIEGILNFSPRRLEVDPSVAVSTVDLTVSLAGLALQVSQIRDGESVWEPAERGEATDAVVPEGSGSLDPEVA